MTFPKLNILQDPGPNEFVDGKKKGIPKNIMQTVLICAVLWTYKYMYDSNQGSSAIPKGFERSL